NPHDTLNISIQSGLTVTDYNFISLGTESRPFAGTLNIPTSGIDVFDLFDCPLFDYVTTDLTVTGGGTVKIQRDAVVETPPEHALTHGALFANHVVAGTNSASWTISLEEGNALSYEGLIGTIADGCNVTISFTNVKNIPISGSSSIGYICGTLGDGATLAVTTAGSGSAISVSTSGGHAGGVVGMMGEDAILRLNSANNTRVNSVTTTAGYAGGVVGYVDHVSASTGIILGPGVTDYAVSGSVTGGDGAGGLFGYYRSYVNGAAFNLNNTYAIASGMTVSSSGNTGGVFGYLVNYGSAFTFNGNASGGETLTLSLPSGTARGGVAGRFTTNNLTNSLTVTNVTVTLTANTPNPSAGSPTTNDVGGLIGLVAEAPAYIAISNVRVTSAGTSNNSAPGAGLIGDPGDGGSFVDVSGNVTIVGRFYAGLIETLSEGVLRVAGTTDLSSYNQHNNKNDLTSGTIVRIRGRSLVYALGSGENAGWTLKRNTTAPNANDDIFSWGEILRIDNSNLTESGIFNVNMTAHTVTVKSGVTTITDADDFAKTTLNIQLGTAAAKGALQFQTATQSATLLAANLTLDDDIDLTGTGIIGMTRDDGSNAAYTGTFDGDGHTLTLALGEVWGLTSTGAALPASSIDGYIRRHRYNALFAKTDGATFQDLTVDGVCQILEDVDNTYLAGLSATATGGLTLTDVTMTGLSLVFRLGTNYTTYVGGVVGYASGDSLAISVSGGEYRPTVTDTTPSDKGGAKRTHVGGVVGYVANGSSQTIAFDSTTIGLTYTKPDNIKRESCFGSAIASTSNQAYTKEKRQITLTDVDVEMSASGSAANRVFGGILGTEWFSADVTLDGVEIVSAAITETSGSAADFGGLVYAASGHWDVKDFTLTSANFSVTETNSTFGLLTNKSFSSQVALYLELDNTGSHYNIGGANALTFTGSTGTFSSFDEIVADTRFSGKTILDNGNSIVSIKTSDNVINTSGSQNTYHNKTAYGKSANGAINPNSRYYYNISYAVDNIGTAKYKLLVWTVKKYAHSKLAEWFGNPSSSISGTIDLTGLSYYPINLASNLTFSTASIKLDNITMEANVKNAYSGDAGSRSTRSSSQHYLMHAGLFLNATANLTVSTRLTLSGNVPKISNDICGFLIASTLGGTDNATPTAFNASRITLDGVYVSDGNNHFTTTAYAPLLINKIGRNTNMTLSNVTQTNYGADLAGSSLIGDVGNASAHGITLTFSGIALDGRNNSSTDLDSDTTTSLNGVYNTSKSIFSRATLLNSFTYASESSGTYNFTADEDWHPSTHAAIHGVTYGYELTTSVEHPGKQNKYSGSDTIYTDPSTWNKTASPYNFTTYFLPYVYVTAVPAEYKHELSVNVNYNITISGFGKYDQPFLIDDGEKLRMISKIIKGDNDLTAAVKVQLPGDLTDFDYESEGYGEYLYAYGASNFTSSNGGTARSNANVRRYLAGAYYAITCDIDLPSNYPALGQTTQESSHPEYLFHGVIFGSGGTRTITNKSMEPLVHSSSGCVIKDLVVHVATDNSGSHVISLVSSNATFQYGSGQASYGALIRQILGGDTIIDDVKVTFETEQSKAVSFAFTTSGDNNYSRLIPVGGYVGTLVNGGLIFRNMREDSDSDGVYEPFVGLTAATYSAVSDAGYLYVNPIIGRVIAGYAFCENCEVSGSADAYAVTSAFSNGTKNYALANLNPALSKLSVAESDGQFTVTVPNGQALFVLGAIVNSGAASATYSDSAEQAYDALSGFWQAYRQWTATREGATYDHIGDTSHQDFTKVQADAYDTAGSRTGVPYIIRTYTAKNGSLYFARALTSRSNNIISVTGDCDVAAGFRGIGSIYTDTTYASDRVHLGIDSMVGTGSPTITLHMSFSEYDGSVTSYRVVNGNSYSITEANMVVGSNLGYGLFNRLYMTGTTGYIEGFTLSGNVTYALRQVSNGAAMNTPAFSAVKGYVVMNVGALAGTAHCQKDSGADYYTSLRIRNVSLSALTVEGPRYAGGLVGCFINPQNGNDAQYTNYVTNCPVSTTTVRGGKAAGSYFGYANVGGNNQNNNAVRLIITGDSTVVDGASVKTTVAPTAVTVFGAADAWEERISPAAGGLIGCADVAYNVSGAPYLQIRHIRVAGGTLSAPRSNLTNYDGSDKEQYKKGLPAAGGIIGKVRGATLTVTDCEVLHVDMNADAAGGILGYAIVPRDSTWTFERLLIDGDKGDSTKAKMDVWLHAGGVIGRIYAKNASTYVFRDIRVSNYDFESDCNVQYGTAAGILGNVYIEQSTNKNFSFQNLAVTGCSMTVITTTSGSSYREGVGGLFGALSGYNSQTKYTGYNLLVNATFAGAGTGNAGAVLGNNVGNTAIVKLVGVSANVTPGTKTLSYTENTNGYSVYADFSQVSTNTAFAGIDDGNVNTDNCTNVTYGAPYATINPAVVLGTKTVTGDSTADSVANLPIQTLLTEYAGGSRRYGYAGTAYYSGGSGDTNYAVFNAVKNSAFAMFSAETLGYGGTDFPVLVIETTEENVTHRTINSYIRLLTNTTDDYGVDVAGKYQVVIYNMAYDNGAFTPVYGEASLKRLSNKFRMTNTAYDSGKLQFSLIDVRFFDPADASKVAYHLYVPVFVKKVLTFEFDVAAASGTTYLENQYVSSFGQRLIANVGAPVTLYFRYTYSRTAAEWETAINAGETPDRHYAKKLTLQKANNNTVLKDFDEGKETETILVLVDKNDGGKPYYAKLSDALSGTTIDLSVFKETMGRDGSGNYTFSGNSFVPKNFSDMLTLTVNSTGDGRTMVACAANAATVTVNGQGYRPATESELEDGSVAKYSISVGAISGTYLTEKYYLSIFTEGGADYDLFHYFIVTSPSALLDNVTYPARISDTDPHTMIHLVMGKIFDHGSLTVSSASNRGALLMTSGNNNALTTTLSVQIGISSALGDLRDEVRGYVSATGFYQSFLIYLTRHVGNVQNKAILGNPTATGSYGVNVSPNTAYQNANIHVTQTFAEFVTGNLGSAFAGVGNYTTTINASATLTYSLEGAVIAQFPGRNGAEENGVTLSASSNIAFSPTTTSYSKNSINREDSTGHCYYSEADVENATLSCQPFGDRSGDFTPFGINALNDPPETLEILPTMDFTPIVSQVRGQYADAVVTVTLRQKLNDGTYGDSDVPNIKQYIPSLMIGDVAASNLDHESYYSAVIDSEDMTENA
ncbi:MAG: hypothetical protein IKX66_02690, partial [Clostridia bacterium]|nr:hypothetical protein [Clostridia bacterium]